MDPPATVREKVSKTGKMAEYVRCIQEMRGRSVVTPTPADPAHPCLAMQPYNPIMDQPQSNTPGPGDIAGDS